MGALTSACQYKVNRIPRRRLLVIIECTTQGEPHGCPTVPKAFCDANILRKSQIHLGENKLCTRNVTVILQLDLHQRVSREIIQRSSSNDLSSAAAVGRCLAGSCLQQNIIVFASARCHAVQAKTSSRRNICSLAGTFGQSESWSVPVRSSWKHPAAPSEVTNDLSCTRDGETQSLNANLPNGAAAGEAGSNAGELKVGGVASQMINWVFTPYCFLLFLCGLNVLGCFSSRRDCRQ